MALTGQLSDMSLAELIEFFCNQRKTGRLKIDYPRGHSVFFIKDGELVDARVGALSGAEAVYFSLTLPNAAFDFSPEVLPTRRTINESWTQVVLEGLRRLDEGQAPTEADAFGGWSPSDADMVTMFDQVERLGTGQQPKQASDEPKADEVGNSSSETPAEVAEVAPLSLMVDGAEAAGGGRKKWVAMGVAAAVVLACVVAAIPLSSRLGTQTAASAAASATSEPSSASASQPTGGAPSANDASNGASEPAAVEVTATEAEAVEAARLERERREREARERERRERERRAEEQAKEEMAAAPKPTPAPPAGPKTIRVSVTYDEAGRVTQASVAGTSPGAEAYGGTALRVARGKRFPAGKPGSTVITIPVN
jgi:TonB family protein